MEKWLGTEKNPDIRDLSIPEDVLSMKIVMVPFRILDLVAASQKNEYLALEKRKNIFLYEQVENSSWQCCLKCQDAPFCQRASSYHEVCDRHAHPLVMIG